MVDIVSVILEEMMTDSENRSEDILDLYEKGTEAEKNAIDSILIYLCGWSVASLKRLATERNRFVEE